MKPSASFSRFTKCLSLVCSAQALTMLLLFSTAAATPLFSQTLSFSTPERDSTTPISGEYGRVGVGAANINNELWVAYIGTTTVDGAGDAYVYTANNSNGGINYGNKSQVTAAYGTVAGNSNPALAYYNGEFYLAYNDGYGNANFVTSSDGVTWGPEIYSCNRTATKTYTIDASPTMAVFGGVIYVGLRDHTNQEMIICQIFPGAPSNTNVIEYSSITLNFNPGLGVFNGVLYAAIESNDSSHTIYFYTSSDGNTWTLQTGASQDQSSTAPTLAVHNGILYMGFRSNDARDLFFYKYSTDGVNFTTAIRGNTAVNGNPTLLEATTLTGSPNQGDLYLYWGSDSSPQYLCSDFAE